MGRGSTSRRLAAALLLVGVAAEGPGATPGSTADLEEHLAEEGRSCTHGPAERRALAW